MSPPATPHSNIVRPMGPDSPPYTPTTMSPANTRQKPPNGRSAPSRTNPRSANQNMNGHAGRNGQNRTARPPPARTAAADQLSPRSSDPSSGAEESDDSGSSGSASPPRSLSSDQSEEESDVDVDVPASPIIHHITHSRVVVDTTLILEEISDFDSDDDHVIVIRPHLIEYAESDRSRSRSRNHQDREREEVTRGIRDLRCTDSDSSDLEEADYRTFLLKHREERRRKRMSSGSIGKRTFRESIGSASDREDLRAALLDETIMGAAMGTGPSTARRLRRKTNDRRSMQFHDQQTHPRIDELEEPNSSDDEMLTVGEALAKELPYYTIHDYVTMEVDSA